MLILSGCSNRIKQDFAPSLEPTLIQLPEPATERDYQLALTMCIIERKVLRKDIERIGKTNNSINRKWWELWK
jgi:hypothetical protein